MPYTFHVKTIKYYIIRHIYRNSKNIELVVLNSHVDKHTRIKI